MNFKLIRCSHHGSHVSSRSSLTGSSRSEYEQPREGTRTPISDVIHCSTGHRIMIHWARGDEGPPQRSINNGIPIIDPHPSLLTPRPRETTPRAPTLPHKLKQRLHDQTRAVAAPDTLVYSNPIGRRISHDMVGPYTISHDLSRSPTTWSAHRSTAHGPAAFLALSAATISL